MLTLLFLVACDGGDKTGETGAGDTGDTAGGDSFDAAAEFSSNCAGCHNADGSGGNDIGGQISADLRVAVPAMTDEEILDVFENGNGNMPKQFAGDSATQEAMLAYLRSTFP
jgi:mono/diheme cytochrome c family protein